MEETKYPASVKSTESTKPDSPSTSSTPTDHSSTSSPSRAAPAPTTTTTTTTTTANPPPGYTGDAPRAVHYSYPPPTRFQLAFPTAFERWFAPFDDALVALCQRNTTGLTHLMSYSLTFFTSIEVSLAAPPALYALGYDAAAGLCSSVLLVLGIVSQIPKKFIHRPRPWMVARAVPVRRDKTSSFPSRAVVCSVVFSWLVATSLHLEGLLDEDAAALNGPVLWACIVAAATLTSFARINVGAHYPSDTILGFVLGCVVLALGVRVESAWRARCGDPPALPLPPPHAAAAAALASWPQVVRLSNWSPFAGVTAVAYAMTLISIQGFWVKCSYVYGLLMASAAFRATYMCGGSGATVARVAVGAHGSLSTHVRAALTFGMLLLFGMATKGKKGAFRVFSFTLIYFASVIGILYWRLRPGETALG